MNVPELMTQIRLEMTGDLKKDMEYLTTLAEDLRKEPNADELTKAVMDHAFSIMPEDVRKDMEDRTMIGGKRMDLVYRDALALVDAKKMSEAKELLAALSDKIAQYYEGGDPKYFSFRNPFEYHMYRHFYPEDTNFDRAPFDFSAYLSLYGYVLIEERDIPAARKVLLRAQKFDPVSADARFEMAELCKLANNMPDLLKVNQETLPLCTSADRMARVLANMGYYCYVTQDFYSAAVFYFESVRFAPSKAVEFELQDVVRRMNTFGQKFAPPTKGQTLDVYEKYSMKQPPNSELVNLAVVMIQQAHKYNRTDLEAFFNRCAYDLTNDPQFREAMERIAAAKRAENQSE